MSQGPLYLCSQHTGNNLPKAMMGTSTLEVPLSEPGMVEAGWGNPAENPPGAADRTVGKSKERIS